MGGNGGKLDIADVLRYLGVKDDPGGVTARMAAEEADRLMRAVRPRYVYRIFPIAGKEEGIALEGSGIVLPGELAGRMLGQCARAALLACTLGAGFETMLRAAQARDMARAVILDACGSVWAEAGCDVAERELRARCPEAYLTDRFSPRYGDLPLALQSGICAVLDAQRRLGIQVTESCLMNPTKSVTAVIGLSDRPQPARIRGCAYCSMAGNCALRKEGKSCGT